MCSIVVEITRNKNMKLRDRTLAEIGKFCLDIAKYCVTVILLNRFLNSDSAISVGLLMTLVIGIVSSFFLGYYFLEKTGYDYKPEPIDKAKKTSDSSTLRKKRK